jgi:mannose-6-phosphate isomerase
VTLLLIGNQPMPYAWGSEHLLQEFANQGTDGQPAAEIWFGSHPTAPSEIIGEDKRLNEIAPDLAFMVKFLAAAKPLSIQAHPSLERAKQQFALGNKSYSDANHKPEMTIAITDFDALCGFRALEDIEADLNSLAAASEVFRPWLGAFEKGGIRAAMEFAFEHNLSAELAEHVTVLARARVQLFLYLADHFPDDVGLMIGTILLRQVSLAPGEGLFLPAGNIHAYLKGLAVEVMAASDNVVRGGLTPKRIDVPELMEIVDFSPIEEPKVKTRTIVNGLTHYPANVSDFSVYRVEPSATNMLIDLKLEGSMIAVCTAGEIEISTSKEEFLRLKRGQAAFVADTRLFSVTGSGAGYLAMG